MVYTQMLFALILDKLVFGTNPNMTSLFGSALILSSAIYVAIQKESMKQREEAKKARLQAANGLEMETRLKVDEEKGVDN